MGWTDRTAALTGLKGPREDSKRSSGQNKIPRNSEECPKNVLGISRNRNPLETKGFIRIGIGIGIVPRDSYKSLGIV